jgi:hypothetical protein
MRRQSRNEGCARHAAQEFRTEAWYLPYTLSSSLMTVFFAQGMKTLRLRASQVELPNRLNTGLSITLSFRRDPVRSLAGVTRFNNG